MKNHDDLLLDLGNTRLKWLRLDAAAQEMRALNHAHPASIDGDIWAPLFSLPQPKQVWLASVAGTRADDLAQRIQTHWHCPINRVRTPAQWAGWTNSYLQPERLGVDRFLAMLGALHYFEAENCPKVRIIAIAGTALTIDVINPSGVHLGGLIVPGPTLMRSSLHQSTSELPLVAAYGSEFAVGDADTGLGRSTLDAIGAGSTRACIALINSVAQEFPSAQLYLSGGAAPELNPGLSGAIFAPDLIFRGMRTYAAKLDSA
jgi:type III pantothenate kinase